MRRAFLPFLLCLGACVSKGYVPRSLFTAGDVDPRAVRAMGCLDVGLSVRGPADAPILRAKVGNGCVQPAAIDLGRLMVIARDESGAERPLAIDDPRGEVVPLHLDARREMVEAFKLVGTEKPVVRLCVDLRGIAWSEHQTPPICFAPSGVVSWQVTS
ncbi:MAG: hypothetical protein ACXVEF_13090 [Polyangiales bacterium]